MFSDDRDQTPNGVEVFVGHVHVGGMRLEIERVEVIVRPPTVNIRVNRENWAEPREHTVDGAQAVFWSDSSELLITAADSTMVIEGARLVAV